MAGITGWWAEIFIEPEPAQLTLTGGVPNVEITQDVFIEPTPAVLTLTGSRPSLEQTVRPDPATLTLTGGVCADWSGIP
ncbi:Bacteriophage protein [Mycobacteroides abscessus]|nr:Bacteriophage protein [Mycobacteroides abscessus]